MHFCEDCGNMFYIQLDEKNENSLSYYCRRCNNKNNSLVENMNNFCVSKTHIIKNNTGYKNIINEYTHLDPTLPRIKNNMICPNADCDSNKKSQIENKDDDDSTLAKKEIAYLRYDDNAMKYVYLCCVCKTHWKTDKQ